MKYKVRWNNTAQPNKKDLGLAIRAWQFDCEGRCHNASLFLLYKAYPENRCVEKVLLKVSALNDFYMTRIWKTYAVAERIAKVKGLDALIRAGSPKAVAKVAACGVNPETGAKRILYSFATKYCHFHNPEAYQIYDRYVDETLRHFRRLNCTLEFENRDLHDYAVFQRIVDALAQRYGLDGTRENIDKYLWILGKSLSVNKI